MVRKGAHKNGFFIYVGGSKHLVCNTQAVCCSLGQVLVIRYVILIICLQIQF